MKAFTPDERAKKLAQRQAAWDKTNGRCWYCGCSLKKDSEQEPKFSADGRRWREHWTKPFMTVDHQDPGARRLNAAENLVACCPTCNSSKARRNVEEYRDWLHARFGMFFGGARPTFYGEGWQ